MPALFIKSDATCKVVIDSIERGCVAAGESVKYDLPHGNHEIRLTSIYKKFLDSTYELALEQDLTLSYSFSSVLSYYLRSLELFQYREGGKAGLFEPLTRTIIVEPTYHYISTFDMNGNAIVDFEDGGKKGVINKWGKTVIPCDYDRILQYDNGFIVQRNKLYGLIDVYGKERICLQPYEINVCKKKNSIDWCFIIGNPESVFFDSSGRDVIRGDYDSFSVEYYRRNCFIYAHKNEKIAVYNAEGRLIIDLKYNDVSIEGELFRVSLGRYYDKDSKSCLIDFKGRQIISPMYHNVDHIAGDFYNMGDDGFIRTYIYDGYSLRVFPYRFYRRPSDKFIVFEDGGKYILYNVRNNHQFSIECDYIGILPNPVEEGYYDDFFTVSRNGKVGLVSPSGEIICDCIYDFIRGFVNGYACVEKNNRYGAIDKTGKEIVPCKYGDEFEFSKDGYAAVVNFSGVLTSYTHTNDLINTNNQRVLGTHTFSDLCWLSDLTRDNNPVIRAKTRDSKDCLIDFNGHIIKQYDKIINLFPDDNGCFFVSNIINGKKRVGWVNRFGEEKIPCLYDTISNAGKGLLWCSLDEKKALYSHEGRQLTGFVFDETEDFHGKYCIAKKESGYGILYEDGREITEFKYSFITNFYVNHQSNDHNVFDFDEDGGIYEDDIEGPFRYGLTFVVTHNKERLIIDTKGQIVSLEKRDIGDCEPLPF